MSVLHTTPIILVQAHIPQVIVPTYFLIDIFSLPDLYHPLVHQIPVWDWTQFMCHPTSPWPSSQAPLLTTGLEHLPCFKAMVVPWLQSPSYSSYCCNHHRPTCSTNLYFCPHWTGPTETLASLAAAWTQPTQPRSKGTLTHNGADLDEYESGDRKDWN